MGADVRAEVRSHEACGGAVLLELDGMSEVGPWKVEAAVVLSLEFLRGNEVAGGCRAVVRGGGGVLGLARAVQGGGHIGCLELRALNGGDVGAGGFEGQVVKWVTDAKCGEGGGYALKGGDVDGDVGARCVRSRVGGAGAAGVVRGWPQRNARAQAFPGSSDGASQSRQ